MTPSTVPKERRVVDRKEEGKETLHLMGLIREPQEAAQARRKGGSLCPGFQTRASACESLQEGRTDLVWPVCGPPSQPGEGSAAHVHTARVKCVRPDPPPLDSAPATWRGHSRWCLNLRAGPAMGELAW